MKTKEQLKYEEQVKSRMEYPEMYNAPVTIIPDPPGNLCKVGSTFFYKAAAALLEKGRLTVIGTYYLATICEMLSQVQEDDDYFSKEKARKRGMDVPDHWPGELFERVSREQRYSQIKKYCDWMQIDIEQLEKAGLTIKNIILG